MITERTNDGLLDVDQAARWLGCSRSQVFVEVRAGRLRSLKIGRLRRFTVEGLREYVAQLEASEPARKTAAA